jgi:uncharacterized caspase-like protein
LLLTVLGTQFAVAQVSSKRIALVIGNNDYATLSPLQNAVNDAESVGASLSSIGFTVYLVSDLDRETMMNSIEFFSAKAEDADVAVLYYAGHGAQIDGINYLLPSDFQIGAGFDPEAALNLDDGLGDLGSQLRTTIVLIDACPDDVMLPSNRSETLIWQASDIDASHPRIGTIVSFATTPGTAAYDGIGLHSPYTGALLDHLATPNIDVDLMLRRVRRDVVVNSNGQQVPITLSSLLSEFHLNPSNVAQQVSYDLNVPPTNSLSETGFQQKPILNNLSSGIQLPTPPDTSPDIANRIRELIAERRDRAQSEASDLRALICQRLTAPLPQSCLEVLYPTAVIQ